MTSLVMKRLVALEKRSRKPKPYDQQSCEEQILRKLGLTRERFLERHGSFPAYAYLKMVKGDGTPPKPIPPQYKGPQDYYFNLLRVK